MRPGEMWSRRGCRRNEYVGSGERVGMDEPLRLRLDGIIGMLGLVMSVLLIRPVLPDFLAALLGIVVALGTVAMMLFGVEEMV